MPRDHFIKRHAQTPDVCPRVHVQRSRLLGREVSGGPNHGARFSLDHGLGGRILINFVHPPFNHRALVNIYLAADGNNVATNPCAFVDFYVAKDGDEISEEAFADVARGHSENPATALKGGQLPGPVRENPNKSDDPYQKLLKMKPGQISPPIKYQDRYYILRRGNDVPKTFDDAKKDLEVSLRNRRAYSRQRK